LRALVARAEMRKNRRDFDGASSDRKIAATLTPTSAADFNARGLIREANNDFEGALADYCRAEELNPGFEAALMNQARIMADMFKPAKTQEAIVVLNRLLARSPDSPNALAARAVYLARLSRADDALIDAKHCLSICELPFVRYQIGDVYALTANRPGHAKEAVRLLWLAIRQQPALARELTNDPDLQAIRDQPEFRKLVDAVNSLRSMD